MEDKLSAMPSLGFETGDARIKVANTTFAFDNAELINLLKQRGLAINADNFDLMRQIDKEINGLKQEKLASIVRPVSAFMTFESEEGI